MITIEIPKFRGDTDLKAELISVQWTPGHRPGIDRRPEGEGKFLPTKDIVVAMWMDENSAEFFKRALQGPAFPKAFLRFHKSDGRAGTAPYLEIALSNVLVASYQVAQRDRPILHMTLSFDEAKFKQL